MRAPAGPRGRVPPHKRGAPSTVAGGTPRAASCSSTLSRGSFSILSTPTHTFGGVGVQGLGVRVWRLGLRVVMEEEGTRGAAGGDRCLPGCAPAARRSSPYQAPPPALSRRPLRICPPARRTAPAPRPAPCGWTPGGWAGGWVGGWEGGEGRGWVRGGGAWVGKGGRGNRPRLEGEVRVPPTPCPLPAATLSRIGPAPQQPRPRGVRRRKQQRALMPTSPGPRPTAAKKVVMAASSSASASTPATPTTSMFHW